MCSTATMRPHLLSLALLLAATAAVVVPLASAVCVSRYEKAERKILGVDEYAPTAAKKVVEKPKPYEEATSAKAAGEAEAASASSASPEKVKKEKSKEKGKSDDWDVSAFLKKKKEKENKYADLDGSALSPKKEKKEKSDKSDESSSSSSSKKKKKKKDKSADGSDDYASLSKKEKKEKKAKKKEKKSKEEKPDEDATPVDVSADGEYVPPKEASGSQPMGGMDSPDELPPAAKSSASSDAYASPTQPMGGMDSPDELPASAKSSASIQPMGGMDSPDELPPSAKSSKDPYAGQAADPAKPSLSMETFAGTIQTPPPNINALNPVVKSVCSGTTYPYDCEASIASIHDGGAVSAQPGDGEGVLRLAMEAVREKVIVAMNAATDRMNLPGIEGPTKQALDDCTQSYSDIKSSLESVDAALKRGDMATARTNLDTVETDVGTCDEGFNERGARSVMTDHDKELKKLASDLIAIGATAIRH